MTALETAAPQSTADALRLVSHAIAGSDFRRASDIADAALAQGFIDPALYNARALWLERQDRNAEALDEYQRARALSPTSYALLNAIGLCLMRLHRGEEALQVFDEAIRINPAYGPSHQRRGVVLGMIGRAREAEESCRRAVSLDPRNAEALASLASMSARRGDIEAAERYAARALAIDTGNVTAHAARALIEIERGSFAEAEKRLQPFVENRQLKANARAVMLGLLGDALDGQDRCSEAFAAYADANEELRALHAVRFAGAPSLGEILAQLKVWLGETSAEAWVHPDSDSPEQPVRTHVFLIGFYRSGTTLLEQILASHPEFATLEERDLLAENGERYLTSAEGVERLSRLAGPELESERADYWRRARGHGVPLEGKVFVDKHPLNTAKLPLIYKLFPAAKIVFAIRDPRDVVLSCFRRHFEINAAMYELLTLEGAAHLYDRVMKFAATCRDAMPFEVFEFRYENLLADFDASLSTLCGFVGVPYSEAMKDFATKATGRDIRSPSAHQVRAGLSDRSLGRWRSYENELAPAFPVLDPWVQRFGY